MSIAQRVRDMRYVKGWGPDELANRAEISRTALYQIENGKTGLPRAATLRRIAVALEVPLENLLLGLEDGAEPAASQSQRPKPRQPRDIERVDSVRRSSSISPRSGQRQGSVDPNRRGIAICDRHGAPDQKDQQRMDLRQGGRTHVQAT